MKIEIKIEIETKGIEIAGIGIVIGASLAPGFHQVEFLVKPMILLVLTWITISSLYILSLAFHTGKYFSQNKFKFEMT